MIELVKGGPSNEHEKVLPYPGSCPELDNTAMYVMTILVPTSSTPVFGMLWALLMASRRRAT